MGIYLWEGQGGVDHAYLVYALEAGRDGTVHPLSTPSSPGSTSIYKLTFPFPANSTLVLANENVAVHLLVQLS